MSYLDDLRPGCFIAPESGSEHSFKFNDLERQAGKIIAGKEVLDSDESTAQDQGNIALVFPMEIYFTGENYHEAADAFFDALGEHYTQDQSGLLQHPRWGDIDVFPVKWTQSEKFVDGSQVAHFSVEFRKVFPTGYPVTDALTESAAVAQVNEMQSASSGMTDGLKTTNPSTLANLKGKLKNSISAVVGSLKAIAELSESIIADFEAVQSAINDTIDEVGGSIVDVIASIQYLIRLPGRIITDTMDKINGYRDMIDGLINGIDDPNETVTENQINNAILLEILGGMATAALAEAAVYTEYETRPDGSAAIGIILDGYEAFIDAMESAAVTGAIGQTYTGDHNYLSLLQDIIARITGMLLNKSFDLKAERRKVLTAPSDPITLCAELYGAVDNDTLDFFCRTNGLTGDQFVEIPAGVEVVSYG
ncbi:MAG: hypothetical protein CVV44_03830 [Spirochaetae bacterium HGW-Spirochaetae-1]|jgi:hypothetical protein|nr:MAG: hypothetical protein CVV44_03830 [Spirochaetae bacterium HGW-Spirochaetae-1]